MLIIGVITGPFYDAGHFYKLSWTGSILVTLGIMMTSISKQYWEIMLSQGVLIGLGSGCLFVPSVALLPQYFTTRKAFATGITASGSSLGMYITTYGTSVVLTLDLFRWHRISNHVLQA